MKYFQQKNASCRLLIIIINNKSQRFRPFWEAQREAVPMLLFSVGAFFSGRGRGRVALLFRSLGFFLEAGAAVAGRAEGHDWPLRRVPGLAWIPLGRSASLWPFPARFPFVFSLIVFIVSFPSTFISKIFVKIGDRLDKRILQILYYVIILPALIIFLFSVICCIIGFLYERYPSPDDFAAILGQGLVFLFLTILVFVCIIIPYIQTLLVLFLRRFVKDKEKNKTLRKEQ